MTTVYELRMWKGPYKSVFGTYTDLRKAQAKLEACQKLYSNYFWQLKQISG